MTGLQDRFILVVVHFFYYFPICFSLCSVHADSCRCLIGWLRSVYLLACKYGQMCYAKLTTTDPSNVLRLIAGYFIQILSVQSAWQEVFLRSPRWSKWTECSWEPDAIELNFHNVGGYGHACWPRGRAIRRIFLCCTRLEREINNL